MREVHVVRRRPMIIGHEVSDGVLTSVHNLPLGTRSVEHRQYNATCRFWIKMVSTTENVEVDTIRLRVRVH